MSFYQYINTLVKPNNDQIILQDIINNIKNDIAFPKHSCDYNEISSYLEDNAYYINDMHLFDQLFEQYSAIYL